MNWNSSQFDNMEPIILRAAKPVGAILKHVSPGATLSLDLATTCDFLDERRNPLPCSGEGLLCAAV
jgi:hypothetical protein